MAPSEKKIYTGQHRHTLDDKNRLTIPSAWRALHGADEVFLATPNPGGFISVLPPAATAQLHEQFAKVPKSDLKSREGIAWFSSMSSDFTFDAQGRIALSDKLLEFAGIEEDVVLVGEMSEFSIYDRKKWEQIEGRQTKKTHLAFMRKHNM
jgi:MraZ protein